MIYHDWISVLHQLREKRQSCVLITVLSEHGSVPRDSGSKMVVTQQESYLTIGGGHLEFECIAQARAMLQRGQEILLLNLVKRRCLVSQCADAKEGILTGVHGSLLVGIAKSYPDRLPRRRQLRRRAADKR